MSSTPCSVTLSEERYQWCNSLGRPKGHMAMGALGKEREEQNQDMESDGNRSPPSKKALVVAVSTLSNL